MTDGSDGLSAHGTPEEVFAAAQSALQTGDLAAAFACLVRDDLLKIAGNSIRALSSADPEFEEVCRQEEFDGDALRRLGDSAAAMTKSAASLVDDPESFDGAAHRQFVEDYDAAVTAGLRSVADLPAFAAALEERMHALVGGGSISTSLFEGESLADVEVAGRRAWATRVRDGGTTEDVGFVRQRDGWRIRLFARRPQR